LDFREVKRSSPIDVKNARLKDIAGNTTFWSITYRLFKLKELEDGQEDYGQVAVYLGTIPGHKHSYPLDLGNVFESRRPKLVDGNTAAMLENSWLKPHFKVLGDRSTHFGRFTNSPSTVPSTAPSGGAAEAGADDSGCCDPSPPKKQKLAEPVYEPEPAPQECGPKG